MFSSVLSAVIIGMEVRMIRVEADVSDGLPSFSMVGYLSSQVKEAQDRVRTSLRNAKVALPPKRITVNLAPADLRKESAALDLPVAAAVLAAAGYIPREALKDVLILGELSLNGEVNPVSGILPIIMEGKEQGCRCCIIPYDNLREGRLVQGMKVEGVKTLEGLMDYLIGVRKPPYEEVEEFRMQEPVYDVDFCEIQGQEAVKRAALIAAGGFHNLLLIGPPGSGKTMIARRFPTILPALTMEESLEITKIYSIAGLLQKEQPFITTRPYRSPHHTVTAQALAGGGRNPRPGEVTLAHRGVLFLDEMPEFSKHSLEILRQPMEEHRIYLSRVNGTFEFPADFALLAAMNPCKCGYYPDMNRCTCTPQDVQMYLHRISQPLLDRMDLCVECPEVTYEEMTAKTMGETSLSLRQKVAKVHEIQKKRYENTGLQFNSDLTSKYIEKYCPITKDGEELLRQTFEMLHLSGRAYHRILKVARTIADLEEKETIDISHLSEAVGYRMLDKKYWSGF